MQIEKIHFDVIDSTNSWAKANCHLLNPHALTVVTAAHQTAGRGRFNRAWISPSGQNIYATLCFTISPELNLGHVSQLLALTAAQTLEEYGFKPHIKWPNDVLINDKKVAGILCEFVSSRWMLAGIGLNVNMPREELSKTGQPATSLTVESHGEIFDLEKILSKMQDVFLKALSLFIEQGFAPFVPEVQKRLVHVQGAVMQLKTPVATEQVIFQAYNADGSMSVLLSNGTSKNLVSGEIC